MDCKKSCFLCLKICNNSTILTDTTVGNETLIEIVKLHFWFEFENKMNTNFLCSGCLLKIQNFHEFYLEIRSIHSNMLEVDIKNETDYPIDNNPQSNILSIKKEAANNPESLPINDTEHISEELPPTLQSDDSENNREMDRFKRKGKKKRKRSMDGKIKRPEQIIKKHKSTSKYSSDYLDKNIDKLLLTFSMKCELCETDFYNWDDARDHYRVKHNQKGYLMCCGRKFSVYGRIIEHLIWHDHPDSYKCTICDKSFLDGTCLRKHKNDIHPDDERIYKCDQCPREYPRRSTLNLHLRTMHSKEKREFECHKCGQKFGQESSVRQHFRIVHDQSDSRVCDICAKFFKCSKSYKLHYKLVHTNEVTKVQCTVCQTWLKHEYLLRDHMRVHKPKQPQICKYCGKESPHIRALRAHIKRNHMNISFPCHICNKPFKNPKTLKEHIAIHTGDKSLYTCSFCPKTFRSSANMYAHRKRDHPLEYQTSKLLGINYKNNVDDVVS